MPGPVHLKLRRRGALSCLMGVVLLSVMACGGDSARQSGGGTGWGAPLSEGATLRRIVTGTREILPGLPQEARQELAWPDSPPPQETVGIRPRLSGDGQLIRPAAHLGQPRTVSITLHLNEAPNPRGFLRVSSRGRQPVRWPVIGAHGKGDPAGTFSLVLRVTGPANRLRYLVIVGSLYESGGRRWRAFEGYLIFPGDGGTLSSGQPVYTIDFGYRWPVPAAPLAQARMLRGEVGKLTALEEQIQGWVRENTKLRNDAGKLRRAEIPTEQEARRRDDLGQLNARIGQLDALLKANTESLRNQLLRTYRQRTGLSALWRKYRASNPFRWQTRKEQQRVTEEINQLGPELNRLQRVYIRAGGDSRPDLMRARQAMEAARTSETAATKQ